MERLVLVDLETLISSDLGTRRVKRGTLLLVLLLLFGRKHIRYLLTCIENPPMSLATPNSLVRHGILSSKVSEGFLSSV